MKKSLGRYKIMKEIGRGAMGVVYQGYDPKIDRIVALKTIRKDRLAESRDVEDLVMRFQKEVQATGKLVHPNIIVIYDTGEDEEAAYIAMEYAEGDTLENLIQQGVRFPVEKIIDIVEQICDGLEYTHRQGIVHRDLKPSNIMLLKGERVKITDFGISKAVGAASSPLTQAGILLGTPSYMSPEQIAGTEINGRSDLFSLGIILYQLLTGEKPFFGDTIPTLLYNIVNKDPTPPSQIDSSIPPLYDDVIAKALAKNPDKRYRRAKDFVEDLKRACRGEALKEAPSTEATMTAPQGVVEKIYPKRSRYGLIAGFAVLLLALVLGGYYWMHRIQGLSREKAVSEMRVQERVPPPIEKEPVEPIPPPAPVGTIEVSSIPPGASVFLDGKPIEGPTPTVIEGVSVGERHAIRVEKEGFSPWSGAVEPEPDKSLPIEATLERLVGTIFVSSVPPGASVSFDGEPLEASTPTVIEKVPVGKKYEIRVEKQGFKPWTETVEPEADKPLPIQATLERLVGTIMVKSVPPGAKVYLDDKDIGRHTPTGPLRLSPGKHTVKLKKEGYKVWENEVTVKASEALDLPGVKLQKALGWLNLYVSPWADVYYEGKKLGTTPLAHIRLQEGTRKLVLKNPALGIEREVTVHIAADKTEKKSINITEGMKGKLKISVTPWAHVYVDGKDMGTTPLESLELTVGKHEVQLKNGPLKMERSFTVIIKANEVKEVVSKDVNWIKKE
jgi:serine/threonine-protein kinase